MYRQTKADTSEIIKKLCVSIPPKLSVSELVDYLKGKSALMVFDNIKSMEASGIEIFGQEDIMYQQ